MTHPHRLARFTGLLAATFALVAWGLTPSSVDAGTIEWLEAVNAGPPPVFEATNVFTPSIVNIGALSGDITYEFVVNGAFRATAGSLIGSLTGGQNQAIRFDQFPATNEYGATQYGVADYSFGVPTTYDTNVVLDFVVDSAAGDTKLFVNGVDTGATVPMVLTLNGPVAFGGTDIGNGQFLGDDSFAGTILGFADFDSALSANDLLAHSDAFFDIVVPEPATWTMLASSGIFGLLAYRRRSSPRGV